MPLDLPAQFQEPAVGDPDLAMAVSSARNVLPLRRTKWLLNSSPEQVPNNNFS
jgi:hypothetical protein